MGGIRSVEMMRKVRRELMEEEKRLGREEFLRRQHERVAKFLEGTQAWFVPASGAARRGR
jgi:hypothetical protein